MCLEFLKSFYHCQEQRREDVFNDLTLSCETRLMQLYALHIKIHHLVSIRETWLNQQRGSNFIN